jgi:tetratricopeptide (TPR) repeat protein
MRWLMTLGLLPVAVAQQAAKPAAAKSLAPQQLPVVQQMLARGQLKEAEAQLNALAQQHPEPPGTERLLGTIHYQRNEFAAADIAFERAIAQDHDDLQAVQMRGTTLYRMGKATEAIPFLERSNSAVSAVNSDSTYALALCYMDVRRYDDARRIFARQYKLTTNSAAAYLFLAPS